MTDQPVVRFSQGAQLVAMHGFGAAARSTAAHRVELADVGQFNVYRAGALREKLLVSMSVEEMQLRIGSHQVRQGGGWVGGGQGVLGALGGAQQARLLNRLTTRTYETVRMTARRTLPNGTQQMIRFAFAHISESALRDMIAEPLQAWTDAYVQHVTSQPPPSAEDRRRLTDAYALADGMFARQMLSADQALALKSHASQPLITAVLAQINSGRVDQREATALREQINGMQQREEITADQADQVRGALVPTLTQRKAARPRPPATPQVDPVDRLKQLELLAYLRQTGALTEHEFQAEKRRLLGDPRDR